MRLAALYEAKNKGFFNYTSIANDKWSELLRELKRKERISFDTENDDSVSQRTIRLDKYGDDDPPRFNCELRFAGGDWEFPVAYFRCQLMDGYVPGLYSNGRMFCFIPSAADGNALIKNDKGYWAAHTDENEDSYKRPTERACWAALRKHLEKMGTTNRKTLRQIGKSYRRHQ